MKKDHVFMVFLTPDAMPELLAAPIQVVQTAAGEPVRVMGCTQAAPNDAGFLRVVPMAEGPAQIAYWLPMNWVLAVGEGDYSMPLGFAPG